MNVPYVGNGVLASSAGMDKVVMKQLFAQAGLKQVPYVHFIRTGWVKEQQQLSGQNGTGAGLADVCKTCESWFECRHQQGDGP